MYYEDQLVLSWGLSALSVAGRPALGVAAAVGAALVELSVALTLLVRRLRRTGLLLAVGCHWLLALDVSQHCDFSSVLFAGFLLFADDGVLTRMAQLWRGFAVRVPVPARLVGAALALVAVLVTAAVAVRPGVPMLRGLGVYAGHGAWVVLGTAVVVLVAVSVLQSPSQSPPGCCGHPSRGSCCPWSSSPTTSRRRGGRVIEAAPVGADAAGQGDASVISRRLQSFRIVDSSGAERCQGVFSPAR